MTQRCGKEKEVVVGAERRNALFSLGPVVRREWMPSMFPYNRRSLRCFMSWKGVKMCNGNSLS